MPEGIGNLFAGLLQGFGSEFLNYRKQNYAKELQDHENRLNYVGTLLKDPTLRPEAKQQVLADFQTMLKGGSKEEKNAFDLIQQVVGKGLDTGKTTNSETLPMDKSKGDMQMSNSLPIAESPTSGPTGKMSQESLPVASGDISNLSPSEVPSMTKPVMQSAFQSPEELRNERSMDISSQVKAEYGARQPFEMEKLKQQQQFIQDQKSIDRQQRMKELTARLDSAYKVAGMKVEGGAMKATKDMAYRIAASQGRSTPTDDDLEQAGSFLMNQAQSKLNSEQARTVHLQDISRQADQRLQVAITNAQTAQGNLAERQREGGRSEARLGISALSNEGELLRTRLNRSQQEYEKWIYESNNPLANDVDRANAQSRMKGLEGEIEDLTNKMEAVTDKLQSSGNSNSSRNMTKIPQVGSIMMTGDGRKIRIKKVVGNKVTEYDYVP